MKIKIEIDVYMNERKEFEVFGVYDYIDPERAKTVSSMKEQLLKKISKLVEGYGCASYNDLAQNEIIVKDRILNCVKIEA